MQERVCIVLNEREPSKAKAAEALSLRLKELNITTSRLSVEENIVKILLQRKPRIVVLDYLLGDFTTGLDILQSFKNLDPEERPKAIFLTDEPSVPVAVQAMQNGALNYFELEHPQSINNTAREIALLIKKEPPPRVPLKKHFVRLDDLVSQAKNSITLINRAKVLAAGKDPIIILEGARGCGKSALAEAILQAKSPLSLQNEIDLELFDPAPHKSDAFVRMGLNKNCSLIVDNLEADDGTFVELLSRKISSYWPNHSAKENNSYLILNCNHRESALACAKALKAELLHLPSLSERVDDIPLLVQRFNREAQELSELKIKPFSAEICSWLSELEWPGEIKQLRSSVIFAAIDNAISETEIKDSIESNREAWRESCGAASKIEIDPYTAALTLESVNHNYRIASVRLGCSVKTLRETLR